MLHNKTIGLGLRREFLHDFQENPPDIVQYIEIAPENWINMGGVRAKQLSWFSERYPIVAHGLSLSLGGTDKLNLEFIQDIKNFIKTYNIELYTEHISFTGVNGNLYDLLPIPFNEASISNIVKRIITTQDILGTKIAIENASYYAASPITSMFEAEFISEVLKQADCYLHLDVNNVYVNSVNFNFDPYKFLDMLPNDKVVYMHIAGHDAENEYLLIDTHGQTVKNEVWNLLTYAYQKFGIQATTLERDLNIPSFTEVIAETQIIKNIQQEYIINQANDLQLLKLDNI